MKTTKVFIGLFLVLAVASLFLSEWLFFGYALATLIISILLLIEEKKNAQLTSKLADAENEIKYYKERFNLASALNEKNEAFICELESELQQRTESAQKWEAYVEKERARCREKYNRLYKGKKKAVATEQKSEPMKIEPFRMVVNPKQSAIIQQILFDNGYEWIGGDTHVKDTDIKALSFEGDKIMCYDFYPHTDSVYFEDTHLPKLSFKKFMQLYGAKEQPYTIEGKTIKQLVEENLGIKIKIVNEDMYLCGYDRRGLSHWIPFIVGINNGAQFAIDNSNAIMIERYDTEYWVDAERVINAIKKHRNIQ